MEPNLIIADHINGIALPPINEFPFQPAAETKWEYKRIRWLTRIERSYDPDYHGFRESLGYNNNENVEGPNSGIKPGTCGLQTNSEGASRCLAI